MSSVPQPGALPSDPDWAHPVLRSRAPVDLSAVVLGTLGFGALLALWEIAPRAGIVRRTSVPTFSDIVPEMMSLLSRSAFWESLAESSQRWAVGLTISIVAGTVLGISMGRSRVVHSLVDPILTSLYPVPKVAFILLLVLVFGAGDGTRVAIIVLGTIIPITISSFHGGRGIDPKLVWSARALGTGRVRVLSRVIVPAASPQILSGIRIALPLSVFTLLASEFLVRTTGIGSLLFVSYETGQYLTTWAITVWLAVIGFGLDWTYATATRRMVPWLEGDT